MRAVRHDHFPAAFVITPRIMVTLSVETGWKQAGFVTFLTF